MIYVQWNFIMNFYWFFFTDHWYRLWFHILRHQILKKLVSALHLIFIIIKWVITTPILICVVFVFSCFACKKFRICFSMIFKQFFKKDSLLLLFFAKAGCKVVNNLLLIFLVKFLITLLLSAGNTVSYAVSHLPAYSYNDSWKSLCSLSYGLPLPIRYNTNHNERDNRHNHDGRNTNCNIKRGKFEAIEGEKSMVVPWFLFVNDFIVPVYFGRIVVVCGILRLWTTFLCIFFNRFLRIILFCLILNIIINHRLFFFFKFWRPRSINNSIFYI